MKLQLSQIWRSHYPWKIQHPANTEPAACVKWQSIGRKGKREIFSLSQSPSLFCACHAGLACNCRLTCPNFGETFCGKAAIQLEKVTFPRWIATLPPKCRSPVRKSEPARRYASYAHMADPASNHGRKSSHSRTKKLNACSYSDSGISKKTKETKFL